MIRVQPKGLSGLYGRLGYLAGRATAAQREAELAASFAQQIEQQQLSQQHQREMAQSKACLKLSHLSLMLLGKLLLFNLLGKTCSKFSFSLCCRSPTS